jgi:ketosteroid isomerase-like protein
MSAVDVVLQVFRSVEERNPQLAAEVYRDDLESTGRGRCRTPEAAMASRRRWNDGRDGLRRGIHSRARPNASSPRVVAASEDEVVVLWHQRGRDRAGRWLDTPVLGLYQVRDGKLARAQMFYFDPLAAAEFLATSGRQMA